MKKKDEQKDEQKKETLISLLLENDEEKIQEFLIRNGKRKSYCPICFIHEDAFQQESL